MPLVFTLNIEVKNPNTTMAAMNNFEWIAFIDNTQIAAGNVNKRVEIPANNGVAIVPFTVGCDLMEVLKGNSKDNVLNFGLNLAGAGNRPTRVTLKVKPTIVVSGMPMQYPGFISVSHEFGSNP